MCSESWAGSDCSVPRDANSLIWETLLDTQLTMVGIEPTNKIILCYFFMCSELHFLLYTNSMLMVYRTRLTGSSTEWDTL